MFCSKCGKRIDYEAIVCNECVNEQSFFVEENKEVLKVQTPETVDMREKTVEEKPKGSRRVGLGGAIAGVVMGYIALIFSALGMCYGIIGAIMAIAVPSMEPVDPEVSTVGWVFFIFGVAFMLVGIILAIVSLMKSAKSIKVFKKSSPKPIATLILGIVGLDYSIGSLLANYIAIIYVALVAILAATIA